MTSESILGDLSAHVEVARGLIFAVAEPAEITEAVVAVMSGISALRRAGWELPIIDGVTYVCNGAFIFEPQPTGVLFNVKAIDLDTVASLIARRGTYREWESYIDVHRNPYI